MLFQDGHAAKETRSNTNGTGTTKSVNNKKNVRNFYTPDGKGAQGEKDQQQNTVLADANQNCNTLKIPMRAVEHNTL